MIARSYARLRRIKPTPVKGAWWWQYRLYCWIMRAAWRLYGGKVEVRGQENIPLTGPCLLIANHQSYLDAPFLHGVVPRILHPMAKSTQFTGVMGFLLAHVYTFPVRRYQIDPQAARTVMRRLNAGAAVMVYIEGERTWDGRLQPFRRGVLKLMRVARVPVVPVRIDGAYEVWPRWDSKIKPGTLRFSFLPPYTPTGEESIAELESTLRTALSGPLDA